MAIDTQEGSSPPGVEGARPRGRQNGSWQPSWRWLSRHPVLSSRSSRSVAAPISRSAGVTLENGAMALATGDPARITVVNPDGTNARQVTTGKEPDPRAEDRGYFEESAPQWSPDGTEIAFEGTQRSPTSPGPSRSPRVSSAERRAWARGCKRRLVERRPIDRLLVVLLVDRHDGHNACAGGLGKSVGWLRAPITAWRSASVRTS